MWLRGLCKGFNWFALFLASLKTMPMLFRCEGQTAPVGQQ